VGKIKPRKADRRQKQSYSFASIRERLNVPKGKFYEALVALERHGTVTPSIRFMLIKARIKKIGGQALYKKWDELKIRKRLYTKVLGGEPREKYRFEIPETEKGIREGLDEIDRQIAEILHSI